MFKSFAIVIVFLLVAAPAPAQDYGSAPNYSIERWDENYSDLKNRANRSDSFDPLKYIPFTQNPDWYMTLGGQVRDRYDYFNEYEFGGDSRIRGFDLVRILVNDDIHFGPNLRAFVQLDSSLEFGRYGGPRMGDAQGIDIQQAFADLTFPLDNASSVVLRAGRQELIYGAQRLISPNDWRNVRLSFDGAKASVYVPNNVLDLFLVRPVVVNENHLDGDDDHNYFGGVYNVTELPTVLPAAHTKLDLYLLSLNRSATTTGAVNSTTYTVGTRFHTNPAPWDFDVEPDFQFGTYAATPINAYGIAAEAGYTWANFSFTPRAALGIDLASGSANPAHRFNQLFPPQYLYLGHLYLFGRENLIDLHPALTFNLTSTVTLAAQQHFFWRENTSDALYNLSGTVVRESGTSKKAFVGDEFDLSVNWQIQQHWSAYAGYAHFFAGPFMRTTGPHADEDFVYAAVTFTF